MFYDGVLSIPLTIAIIKNFPNSFHLTFNFEISIVLFE